MRIARYRFVALLAMAALVGIAVTSGPALADPPDWAPAHGYWGKHKHKHKNRHKHKYVYEYHHYHHYHHDHRHHDHHHRPRYRDHGYRIPFGIDLGRCNRELLGSVIGGAAGGVIGAQIGKGSGRTAATIGGTVIGVLIGGSIGRTMDRVDYGCVGQTLEYAPDSRPVIWQNPNGVNYRVVPTGTYEDGFGRYCREYMTTAVIGGRTEQVYGTACRQPDGAWELLG